MGAEKGEKKKIRGGGGQPVEKKRGRTALLPKGPSSNFKIKGDKIRQGEEKKGGGTGRVQK